MDADTRAAIARIDRRLAKLEMKVFGGYEEVEAAQPQSKIEVASEPKIDAPPVEPEVIADPIAEEIFATPKHEINIGKLLNWGGITFLVLGAVFALMYSWQYLGAWFKVIGGLVLAGALMFGGEKLSKRDTNEWYGQGLMGGGWALAYFVVYAMQNIQGLKVLDSVLLDCSLLIALASGCMAHAMKKKSQWMAILSTVLAFITISLSSVTTFTVVASAVLVAGATTVAVRMKWQGVLLSSLFGSYITYMGFTLPQIASTAGTSKFAMSMGFLLLFWVAHNIASYLMGETDDRQQVPTTIIILNSIFFTMLGLNAFGENGFEAYRYLFLFITGSTYLACAPIFYKRSFAMGSSATIIGLSAATLALPQKLNDTDTVVACALEYSLLAWAGIKFHQRPLRWFAAVMSVLLFPVMLWEMGAHSNVMVHIAAFTFHWHVMLGALVTASYAASAYSYLKYNGTKLTYHTYAHLAMFAALITTTLHFAEPVPVLAFETVGFLALAVTMRDRVLTFSSYIQTLLIGCVAFLCPFDWTWAYVLPIVMLGYGVSAGAGQIANEGGVEDTLTADEARGACSFMGVFTSAFLALSTAARLCDGPWISVAWALEGLALLAVSFGYNEKWYERSALTLFALLAGRVLFVDFADAPTLQRIVSFVVTGVAFLTGSYAFAWMRKNVKVSGADS